MSELPKTKLKSGIQNIDNLPKFYADLPKKTKQQNKEERTNIGERKSPKSSSSMKNFDGRNEFSQPTFELNAKGQKGFLKLLEEPNLIAAETLERVKNKYSFKEIKAIIEGKKGIML